MRELDIFTHALLEEDIEMAQEFFNERFSDSIASQFILKRKELGLSREEVAEKAQTSRSIVKRVEDSDKNTTTETLKSIANALGCVLTEPNLVSVKEQLETLKPHATYLKIPEYKLNFSPSDHKESETPKLKNSVSTNLEDCAPNLNIHKSKKEKYPPEEMLAV